MDDVVEDLVGRLDLKPHPEGGYYQRTYESDELSGEGADGESSRRMGSAILYLLPASEVSRLHRLDADELWCYHWGSPLTLHRLNDEGYRTDRLGPSLENGEHPQITIPAGEWFGATVEAGYTLVSCVVVPEFDFEHYELANADDLKEKFPNQTEIIETLT